MGRASSVQRCSGHSTATRAAGALRGNSCPCCPKSDIQLIQGISTRDLGQQHKGPASQLVLTLSPPHGPEPLGDVPLGKLHIPKHHQGNPDPAPCTMHDEKNSTEMNGCLRAHGVMGAPGTELKISI